MQGRHWTLAETATRVVWPFEPLSAQRAAHIIISIALGVALFAYGIEEIRRRG